MNACPMDENLATNISKKQGWCRWLREPKTVTIKGRQFVSGGSVMPDTPLLCVPRANIKWLNTASKTRRAELEKLAGTSNNWNLGKSP